MIKKYDSYSEEYKLNENILTNAWNKLNSYFKSKFGKNAWLYYSKYLKDKGEIPTYVDEDGKTRDVVEIIIPDNYLNNLKGDKSPTAEEIESEIRSRFNDKGEKIEKGNSVDEAMVTLNYPSGDEEVMRNVNVEKLRERVKRVYNMNLHRAGKHEQENYDKGSEFARKKTHALFIWGAPGIGKTEILHQVAKDLDIVVQEWHLSQIEPTDFRGVPKIENDKTVSKLPAIFPTSDGNGKGGIMFFDEMNRAPQMVLSASLALALSGSHGDYDLPPRWIIIAAGNRKDDIDTTDLTDDPILWNRFAHVNYSPSVDDWVKYALSRKDINPFLISYLQYHPNYFHRLDKESKSPGWASPRTWEMASQDEFNERSEDWANKLSYPEIQNIYTKYVGLEAAMDFVNYMKLQEFFSEKDIQDIYDGNERSKNVKWPTRQDQIRACSIAIATFKQGKHISKEEVKNVYEFATRGKENEAIVAIASYFVKAHPYIKTEYQDVWLDFAKRWHVVLQKTMAGE